MIGPETVPPGAQRFRVEVAAQAAAAMPNPFEGVAALGVEHFREFGAEQRFELLARQLRRSHLPPSPLPFHR
jgi:hypothetical protein